MQVKEALASSAILAQSLQIFSEDWFIPNRLALYPEMVGPTRRAISLWTQILGDMPLGEIEPSHLSYFVSELLELPGKRAGSTLSGQTAQNHYDVIHRHLKYAGPADASSPTNLGQLIRVPFIPKIKKETRSPNPFTDQEIRAMYAQCNDMTYPSRLAVDVDPSNWWRALITVAYTTGLEISEILGLRYSDLSPPEILVRSQIDTGELRAKRQHLNQKALVAIEKIRTPRERIFGFAACDRNPRYLQTIRKAMQVAAKIPESRCLGFRGFRDYFFAKTNPEGCSAKAIEQAIDELPNLDIDKKSSGSH